MADAFPFELVSFCDKLAGAVATAARENGWRVAPFGRQGFNTDVIVGQTILKITTAGKPNADGSGVSVRFDRGANRSFAVRVGADGLELADGNGAPVSLHRFVELVGEACDAPIKSVAALPMPLQRFLEQLSLAVVTGGQDNGWTLQGFGSRGFNTDVIVGSTTLKVTTEGNPGSDGAGATIRLKKPGYEAAFTTRPGKTGNALELADGGGQAASFDRIVELIADAVGTPLRTENPLSPQLVRFSEKLGSTLIKTGQDMGWDMRPFGKRGFNTDCAVGPNIVKVTMEVKPDGNEATVWIKSDAQKLAFQTRPNNIGELDLTENGAVVPMARFVKLLAEACGTPIEDEVPMPEALTRLLEHAGSAMANAGHENGWSVQQFGKRGLNADVTHGATVLKVTTVGKPNPDGSGVTLRLLRAGFEKPLAVQMGKAGELELTDGGASVNMKRFVALLAEGCGAQLKDVVELPPPLNRFYEKMASTIATAGNANGWKVAQYGSSGFNADLSVGANIVKVSTEGTPGPDGGGVSLRVKRPGFDKSYTTRLGKNSEIDLVDSQGAVLPIDKLVEVLIEAGSY